MGVKEIGGAEKINDGKTFMGIFKKLKAKKEAGEYLSKQEQLFIKE